MRTSILFVFLVILVLLLSGCSTISPAPTPSPVPTVEPTPTPVPTPSPSPTPTPPTFTVKLIATVDTTGNKPIVRVETNLPDGFELSFDISRFYDGGFYLAQDKNSVQNGTCESVAFSDKGKPLSPGNYTLEITSPAPRYQPKNVIDVIGDKGQAMDGRFAKYSDISEAKMIEYKTTFTIK